MSSLSSGSASPTLVLWQPQESGLTQLLTLLQDATNPQLQQKVLQVSFYKYFKKPNKETN